MDLPSSPSIETHLHGSDYHMFSVCQTCGRCHCLEQECPRALTTPFLLQLPTTTASTPPFLRGTSASPLCVLSTLSQILFSPFLYVPWVGVGVWQFLPRCPFCNLLPIIPVAISLRRAWTVRNLTGHSDEGKTSVGYTQLADPAKQDMLRGAL